RVVEGCPERVRQCVAELSAFMDRARSLGCGVARYPARKGELPEEPAEPVLAQADLRIDLAVGAFEVGVRHDPRATVAWTGQVNRVQATPADRAVQVRV